MSNPFQYALASSFRRKSAIVFWLAASIVAGVWSYIEQKEFYDVCSITNGKVVDKLYLRVGRHDTWCPQVSYFISGQKYFFADKHSWADIGDNVEVIYQKNNIENAYIYTFWFWINLRVIILTFLIAFVLFGLIWGLTQKVPNGTEILPSNRMI